MKCKDVKKISKRYRELELGILNPSSFCMKCQRFIENKHNGIYEQKETINEIYFEKN